MVRNCWPERITRPSSAASRSPRARSRCSPPKRRRSARAAGPAAALSGGRLRSRSRGLPRGRDPNRAASARRCSTRRRRCACAPAVLATNLGVHVKIGRERALVGDLAGPWRTGGRRRGGGERLPRPAPVGRQDRTNGIAKWWRRRWSRKANAQPSTPAFRHGAHASDDGPSCSAAGRRASSLALRHPVAGGPRPSCVPHGVRPHAAARRRNRSMKHFVRSETAAGLANPSQGAARSRHRRARQRRRDRAAAGLERHAQRDVEVGTSRPRPSWAATACCCSVRTTTNLQRRWDSGDFRVEEFRIPLVDARVGPEGSRRWRRRRSISRCSSASCPVARWATRRSAPARCGVARAAG